MSFEHPDNSSPFFFPELWESAALEWDEELLYVFRSEVPQRNKKNDPQVKPYCESPASRELLRELQRYVGRRYRQASVSDNELKAKRNLNSILNIIRKRIQKQKNNGKTDTSEFDKTQSAPQDPSRNRPRLYGRSVLLSGIRGSGKTATIYWVIRDLQAKLIRKGQPIRLLPVLISTSTFLPVIGNSNFSTSDQKKNSGGQENTHESISKEKQSQFRILIEICCSLHRAVVREFLRSIRERILELEESGDFVDSNNYQIRNLYELLAQLEQDIEDFIQPRRLREYWRRFGFLNPGKNPSALFVKKMYRLPSYQAIEEVCLLASLNELYLRTVGSVFRESKIKDVLSDKQGHQPEQAAKMFDPSEWRPVIAAALGGSITGIASSNAGDTLITLLSSLSGAIVFGWISSMVPTWKRSRQHLRIERFNKDYSLGTLHREIPRIIDELFQVGICPIFIIDELDKYPQLLDEIQRLLEQFKQFFTTEGFFCFLTHRQFFDQLSQKENVSPYGVTSTWFTNRLFIEYYPWDIRAFLRSSIRISDHVLSNTQAVRDRVIMEYVILFRSKSSMSSVLAVRGQFEDDYRHGKKKLGSIVDNVHLLEVTFQLIVELVFADLYSTGKVGINLAETQLVLEILSLPGIAWKESNGTAWYRPENLDDLFHEIEQKFLDSAENSSFINDYVSSSGKRELDTTKLLNGNMSNILKRSLQKSLDYLKGSSACLSEAVDASLYHNELDSSVIATIESLFPIVVPDLSETGSWNFRYQTNGELIPSAETEPASPIDSIEDARSTIKSILEYFENTAVVDEN